jgi:hypothetical protein
MKALPTFSEYSLDGPGQTEEQPVLVECEHHESRNFLVGLGNGVWMSLVLGTLSYWLIQILVHAVN